MGENLRVEITDELIDSFATGIYATDPGKEFIPGQQAKFDKSFNFVDGVRYPLSLLHPDIAQRGNQQRIIGVESISGDDFHSDPFTVQEFIREMTWKNFGGIYHTERGLVLGSRAYLPEVGMRLEDFRNFMNTLSGQFGHRALAVLDAGCGDGLAFNEMVQIDGVDAENSIGLSLPHGAKLELLRSSSAVEISDPNLLYANIMHCGSKKRFDLLMSIHGAFLYHPTNHYPQRHMGMLSLLHAINLTEQGGAILAAPYHLPATVELLDDGILGRMKQPFPLQVLRRPTVDEVMKYTMASDAFLY